MVLQSYDGIVKVTGVPSTEETGKNLKETEFKFIDIDFGYNFLIFIFRYSI